MDNDYETNKYFIKLLDDFYTAYLTLFSIATGIIYHDISQQSDFPTKEIIRKFNIFLTSVFVFLFILCSLTRYINLLNLDKSNNMILKTTSFWSFSYFGLFLIETLIALLHPNYLVKYHFHC